MWRKSVGRGHRPCTSFYHPRRLPQLTHFYLKDPTSGNWCPVQGSCHPRCRAWGGSVTLETVDLCPRCQVWGLCGSHPSCMGQDPIPGDPTSALYLQCVLSPLRFPVSELRMLPWLTHGPFPSCHLVTFIWGQALLSELLLCVLLSENLWWCDSHIIAYHIPNS